MTTNRFSFFTCLIAPFIFFFPAAQAAPPASLDGQFVLLGSDRLEFPNSDTGNQDGAPFQYTYAVLDDTTSTIMVNYTGVARAREVTLRFNPDGTTNGYSEFDRDLAGPPLPPIPLNGIFSFGPLESPEPDPQPEPEPEPPVDSSAPDSLVGKYLLMNNERFEILSENRGRIFSRRGTSEYFSYGYTPASATTAALALQFENAGQSANAILEFDADGNPVGYTLEELQDGNSTAEFSGELKWGTNRNLVDLMAGIAKDDLSGNDKYLSSGNLQRLKMNSKSGQKVTYYALIENDGVADTIKVRGTKSRRSQKIQYTETNGGDNVTAAVGTGRYKTPVLDHQDAVPLKVEITPKKRRGTVRTILMARSSSVAGAIDMVHVKNKIKKDRGRGGRGHGGGTR